MTADQQEFIPHRELSEASSYLHRRCAGERGRVRMVASAMVSIAVFNMRAVEGREFAAEYLYQLGDALAAEDVTRATPLHLPPMRKADDPPTDDGRSRAGRIWRGLLPAWGRLTRRPTARALWRTAEVMMIAWGVLYLISLFKGVTA